MSGEPVIPEFGAASECVVENRFFCADWVRENWGSVLQPALLEHVRLTATAVGVGFAIAFAAALLAHRHGWLERPLAAVAAGVYTIPSIALFLLLVPITGIGVLTVQIALVSYTLLVLFRNVLAGLRAAPPEVLDAARAMGLTEAQVLRRVELPLALPAIVAGLRVATVSTISIATIAAYVVPQGLGAPIFTALREYFRTEIVAAAVLAIALALAADTLFVLAQRALTPWARSRSA